MSRPYTKQSTKGPCKYFLRGQCHNKQCSFAHVKDGPGSKVAPSNMMTALLKLIFQKQHQSLYDSERNAVNLSSLRKCEDLKDVTASIDFNTVAFCDAVCTVIKETVIPPPSILAVDDNDIKSLGHLLRSLEKYDLHTHLVAFSSRKNKIVSTDFVNGLKSFSNLQELALNDNPVTDVEGYRALVRRQIPHLVGLDMKSIAVEPLSLPWPTFPTPEESFLPILHFVDAHARAGMNDIPDFYWTDACFSLVLNTPAAALSAERDEHSSSIPKDVIRDLMSCKLRQIDNDHNVVKGVRSQSLFRGRSMACSKIIECLYPQNFDVAVELHGCPQVSLVTSAGGKVAIVTVHGHMLWRSLTCAASVIRRRLCRTLVVLPPGADGRLLIANDCVTLLCPDNDDVLFNPKAGTRLDRFSRRFDVHRSIVEEVANMSSNDAELAEILGELRGVPLTVMEECAALADGDPAGAVSIARLAVSKSFTPAEALSAFESIGRNHSRVKELL
jgi:nuclear RNA export factor